MTKMSGPPAQGKGVPVPHPDPFADLRALRPERVCLIKPSALGDIVNALPVLSALRELWPRAHFAWAVNRGLRGPLDGHPERAEVSPFGRAAAGVAPRARFPPRRF